MCLDIHIHSVCLSIYSHKFVTCNEIFHYLSDYSKSSDYLLFAV